MTWIWNPDALSAILSAAGFDVDRTNASPIGGGGSLTARRDRGEAVDLVAVDAGGRVRATITRQAAAPTSSSAPLDGVTLRLLTELTRTTTLAGELTDLGQFQILVSHLDDLGSDHAVDHPAASPLPPPPPLSRPLEGGREATPASSARREKGTGG